MALDTAVLAGEWVQDSELSMAIEAARLELRQQQVVEEKRALAEQIKAAEIEREVIAVETAGLGRDKPDRVAIAELRVAQQQRAVQRAQRSSRACKTCWPRASAAAMPVIAPSGN